ncbi:Protein byr4 [Cladobotryum mycophilum]|uniref:Protein byr4 n=1 Tax=Cladobotryum mycophilum TaxID=491253 RepID=A0ABR0SZD8_9HYPO
MEPLRLKPRKPVDAAEVENWDDDDFEVEGDELSLRSSTATSTTSVPQLRRRDSTSSHISLRSDLDSWQGDEQQVHLPGDDERSTMAAIAAAESAGIPLPKNVPSSALTGGTIKRLGGRKIRKIIQEDWENDLELPDPSQGFQMKLKKQPDFPETLRQVSGGSIPGSPNKPKKSTATMGGQDSRRRRSSIMSNVSALSAALSLDRFRDTEDDDDFFGGETIKVTKNRLISRPKMEADDDFEKDLELPSDGKLKLSTRRDIPKAPLSQVDDLDWGEGSSLGTRYGGTGRGGRSARSSSVSALSPSVSSSFTAESEDETFDGLVLPPGPVNFQERLHLRKKSPQPELIIEEPDFLEGLEIGDGDVFKSGKLTLHKNIKIKNNRPSSPARPKTAVSLTFTNKPTIAQTRIPRLNERPHSTALEPVSESGGPIPQKFRRSKSRLGHSAQSSVSSLPTPTGTIPPTPRRGEITTRSSYSSLRNEPSTTSAQLLRQKRSLPGVRTLTSPGKTLSSRPDRPPSRTDSSSRPNSGLRPKTPIERHRSATESPTQTRKNSVPFLPAGASQSQSQHITSKTTRPFRRHDSDNLDVRPPSRSLSRAGLRSPSPHRYKVASDTWERLSRPKNRKHFGDGHELDAFDDLPTSKESESKYLKQPVSGGPKNTLRRVTGTIQQPDRTQTPSPWSPQATKALHSTPSFARDTASSRIARETSLAHRTPSGGHLAAVSAQRAVPVPPRGQPVQQTQVPQVPQRTIRSKKSTKRPPQLKPHLISNLNSGKESKIVNGMFYNAETYLWEGNENALNAFDATATTPSSASVPHLARDKETTPRPALITNFSATKGVQVVGGMVFDPQNMCWIKLGPQNRPPHITRSEATDSLDGFNALDEEEDVFKDIPDLEENTAEEEREGRTSDIKDDWLVGEEFDVGPEFIRRQREEEERWRRKCEKWISRGPRDREAWRWTIRELVSQFDELPMPGVESRS